jgi:hypothetical protein
MARIEMRGVGVSNRSGTATPVTAPNFEDNRGTSRVVLEQQTVIGDHTTEIEVVRPDAVVAGSVGVLTWTSKGMSERRCPEHAVSCAQAQCATWCSRRRRPTQPRSRAAGRSRVQASRGAQHLHRSRLVASAAVGDRGSWDPAVFLAIDPGGAAAGTFPAAWVASAASPADSRWAMPQARRRGQPLPRRSLSPTSGGWHRC